MFTLPKMMSENTQQLMNVTQNDDGGEILTKGRKSSYCKQQWTTLIMEHSNHQ